MPLLPRSHSPLVFFTYYFVADNYERWKDKQKSLLFQNLVWYLNYKLYTFTGFNYFQCLSSTAKDTKLRLIFFVARISFKKYCFVYIFLRYFTADIVYSQLQHKISIWFIVARRLNRNSIFVTLDESKRNRNEISASERRKIRREMRI